MSNRIEITDASAVNVPAVTVSDNTTSEQVVLAEGDNLPDDDLDLLRAVVETIKADPSNLASARGILEYAAEEGKPLYIRDTEYKPDELREIYALILTVPE